MSGYTNWRPVKWARRKAGNTVLQGLLTAVATYADDAGVTQVGVETLAVDTRNEVCHRSLLSSSDALEGVPEGGLQAQAGFTVPKNDGSSVSSDNRGFPARRSDRLHPKSSVCP